MPKREITHINLIGNSGASSKSRRVSRAGGPGSSRAHGTAQVEGSRFSRSKARRGR